MNIYITIILQFSLIVSSILILFRFRKSLGLAPLYLFLGSIQYLQSLSGSRVSLMVLDDLIVFPGSVIIFSSILFAVLLIYIKEGATSARVLILGMIISNFLLLALYSVTYDPKLTSLAVNETESTSFFLLNYRYFAVGKILLLLDFIWMVVIYQFLISKIKKLPFFLVLFTSLVIVLFFDAILFNLIFNYGEDDFNQLLLGQILGKSIAALLLSVILYTYLKFIDSDGCKATFIASQDRDVFSILQYKKRYLDLKVEKHESEEKLTNQLETSLNNISDGFVALDTNWCYTYVNKKAADLLGKSKDDLLGKHIWDIFPEGKGLSFYKAYHEAIETQKTIYFEDYYEPLDKWFENRIYPSKKGVTIYFTDITEIKKADANNVMLGSLIETSDEFIGLATLEGKPIYLNTNGRKLVGLNTDLEHIDSITDFFPQAYKDVIINEQLPYINKNNKWSGETYLKNFKTGDFIPIEKSGFLIKDPETNKPIALGIVAKDITQRKEAEEKLKNSEQQFRRLAANAPVAIFQSDTEGNCNYVNEEWLKYSGQTFSEALGFGWSNAIHPEDRDMVLERWKTSIMSNQSLLKDFRLLHKNGEVRWISAKAVGVFDVNKELTSYIGILNDITERKKAEEQVLKSERYLENIINNIADPVFVKDEHSHILLANNAFCNLLNLAKEDVIGKTLAENVLPSERDEAFRIDKEVLDSGIDNINEETMTLSNKETLIISTKKTRFVDSSNAKFLIGVIRDITERKKAELELENYKNNLEKLVETRTAELEKEKEKAQSADLMKSAFLATMSHELRTPMNSIIGFTGILIKELAGPLNEEQKRQLTMVKNSGEHLLSLINDVLDISRIEAGKLKVTYYPFDYLAALERTIDFLLPQALAKGLKMRTEIAEIDITLISDERRVEQIFLNLLSNAIKFSKIGTILVKVQVIDDYVVTEVIDEGVGIQKDDLVRLFMPFVQLETGLSRSHEGTGLGLAICKNLIEKLGGTLQVSSEIGVGSNFTFKLPLKHSNKINE
ncbi:PAS domain S-box protein [Winogradskyella psychrotolerans]|uniref:PAS domain S-box protein n=1 Tax=Winogradskyella psychrotolerans TaxID=1344585 RepID=UPI001C071213|nr:PAS domain S-box protein [Winogradskyella psychrotolerans]MBU2920526.1 PAS domain S-box protein [Winogradskyella psychrotolerans]